MDKTIIDTIHENESSFQLNFLLLKPKKKRFSDKSHKMININKYQTNGVIIFKFNKSISRVLK